MKRPVMPNLAMADMFKQLALLMHAGVALCDGCFLLAEEEANRDARALLRDVARKLETGETLAAALRACGRFPAYVTGLLDIGERVGRTEETLLAISGFYEEQHARQRYLRNAVTYPMILLMLMMVVIVVLLTKVLPVFDDIYASLGGSLTGIAGGLLALGGWLNAVMPILVRILLPVVAVTVLCVCVRPLREAFGELYQVLFGDRGVSRRISDARLAEALAMAMASGMPLEECFSLAAALLADVPKAVKRCEHCKQLLDEGKTLAEALKESHALPAASCRMLVLGIRAGSGDAAMEQIARRLSEEARDAVRGRVAKIEPALVVITSLMVGAILLSVMLPLMNIMKAIG